MRLIAYQVDTQGAGFIIDNATILGAGVEEDTLISLVNGEPRIGFDGMKCAELHQGVIAARKGKFLTYCAGCRLHTLDSACRIRDAVISNNPRLLNTL